MERHTKPAVHTTDKNPARQIQIHPLPTSFMNNQTHSQTNLNTPDDDSKLSPHTPTGTYAHSLDQVLSDTGFAAYISDFQHIGISSLSDLIRFSTHHLPYALSLPCE